MVDGELGLLRDEVVIHVFERENFSRASYDYMISWIQKNKDPTDDIDEIWTAAEAAWDSLSPEICGMLVAISEKERQQNKDIHDGLLATLYSYQGVKHVKSVFEDAIHSCLW
jgi:hypothetical protein